MAKQPSWRLKALVEYVDQEGAKDTKWVELGVLWETRNAGVFTGELWTLPVAWQNATQLRVAIEAVKTSREGERR
jgi:hypothetical protein